MAAACDQSRQIPVQNLRKGAVQGTTQGFVNCVYVHDADYTQDAVRKILFLLFWVFQHIWIACFPALLAYAMMPRAFKRMDKIIVVVVFLVIFLSTVIPAMGYGQPLDANFFYAIIGESQPAGRVCKVGLPNIMHPPSRLLCP